MRGLSEMWRLISRRVQGVVHPAAVEIGLPLMKRFRLRVTRGGGSPRVGRGGQSKGGEGIGRDGLVMGGRKGRGAE